MKGDFPEFLEGLCCPFDKEVTKQGTKDCDHEWYKLVSGDTYVIIECKKCNRKIYYGVWD